jgi:hypothetical protein
VVMVGRRAEAGRWRVADRQGQVTGACANALPVVPRSTAGIREDRFFSVC